MRLTKGDNVKHMLLSLDARHFGEFFTVGLIHFARGDGPSGDPTGPSGNPTGSSGDPTGPSGNPTGSYDDPTGPSGDPIGPSGDPIGTSGDHTRPFVTLFSYKSALMDWASIITFWGYYY